MVTNCCGAYNFGLLANCYFFVSDLIVRFVCGFIELCWVIDLTLMVNSNLLV